MENQENAQYIITLAIACLMTWYLYTCLDDEL